MIGMSTQLRLKTSIKFQIYTLVFILAGIGVMVPSAEANQKKQINRAVESYKSAMEEKNFEQRRQKYEQAEQSFCQIVEGSESQAPIRNADLLVNLGNAAIQAERIGPAIAAYRQALLIAPGNAKARQNLAYARSVMPEWIRAETQTGIADSLFFWTDTVSPERISLIASICFAIAILLWVVGVWKKQRLVRTLAVLPMLIWLILLFSNLASSVNRPRNDLVVTAETILYSADSENSNVRISKPLPSGAEVRLEQERDRWLEVVIPGNISGWILNSTATRIVD